MVNSQYGLAVTVHSDLTRYHHCLEKHWRLKAMGFLDDFLKFHGHRTTLKFSQGATADLQRADLFCNMIGSLLARAGQSWALMNTLLAEARQVRAELWKRLFHGLGVAERGRIQLLYSMPQDASTETFFKCYCALNSHIVTWECEIGEADTGPGPRKGS